MEIPLTLFLALYGAAVIIFLVLGFFLLYHAVRFGQVSLLNFFSMGAFVAGAVALIYFSAQFIDVHNWSLSIDVVSFVRSIFF